VRPIRTGQAALNRSNGPDQRTYACKFHAGMVERPAPELVTS